MATTTASAASVVHNATSNSNNSASVTKIPCCLCGTYIIPNGANQCGTCLAQNFDLREMIQGNNEPLVIHQCRQCRRYARTETHYEFCEVESSQLLSICLKHIPVLVKRGHSSNRLKILDASWIWTEPNSMRLKARVTVRTDVEGVTIQQRVPVEYIIKWRMCNNCNREYTNRTWHALVQLRQKRDSGSPRKGLAALEMALSRSKDIRKNVMKIDTSRNGLDFYFLTLPQAQQFSQFLFRLAPMRTRMSSKMVSEDNHNNTANMKYTLACDMVPLCRDDLILVHKQSRSTLGGRLGLVSKVSSIIHIVDASPKRNATIDTMELSADGYHKGGAEKGFTILQTSERMVRFVVLDVELCHPQNNSNNHTADTTNNNGEFANDDDKEKGHCLPHQRLYEGPSSGIDKFALADVQVARESDLGSNDEVLCCVTHLGHLIQPGDIVLGYDLVSTAATLSTTIHHASSSSSNLMGASGVVDLEDVLNTNVVLQDVILVKKISSKEQKQLQQDGNRDGEDDSVLLEGNTKKGGTTKKKLRRQKKMDRKQRELEDMAARMGFLDDIEEQRAMYAMNDDNAEDDEEQDPDFADELAAVEREFFATYPEGSSSGDGGLVEVQEDQQQQQPVEDDEGLVHDGGDLVVP